MLLYDRNIIGPSSEIFGNCPKNVQKHSSFLRNNFGKIFGKSSKRRHQQIWYRIVFDKQNITCLLVDMTFIFSCSTRHLTSERSQHNSLHLKIKYAQKICSKICSKICLGHYPFLAAHSRFMLSENCSILGTANVRG